MNEEKLSREEDVSSINIMELLYKMLEKWHLFLIAIVVAIIVCIFITKYSTPLYEAKTTLLIKNNSNMMSNLSGNFGFNFFFLTFRTYVYNIDNFAYDARNRG